MEISPIQPYEWDILLNPHMFIPNYYYYIPQNYVRWRETPDSHIYYADIPGVRKEEIKVEVEESKYLIIRSETSSRFGDEVRTFMKKFRLPGRVDIEGISAAYEDGVLTITVPKTVGFHIHPADLNVQLHQVTAKAA